MRNDKPMMEKSHYAAGCNPARDSDLLPPALPEDTAAAPLLGDVLESFTRNPEQTQTKEFTHGPKS